MFQQSSEVTVGNRKFKSKMSNSSTFDNMQTNKDKAFRCLHFYLGWLSNEPPFLQWLTDLPLANKVCQNRPILSYEQLDRVYIN